MLIKFTGEIPYNLTNSRSFSLNFYQFGTFTLADYFCALTQISAGPACILSVCHPFLSVGVNF